METARKIDIDQLKRKSQKIKAICVYMPEDIYKELDVVCKKLHLSKSKVIRQGVQLIIDQLKETSQIQD